MPANFQDTSITSCIHYGTCGGCSLQHLTKEAYVEYKHMVHKNAIEAAGFSTYALPPPTIIGPYHRRRTQLKVKKTHAQEIIIGYYQAKSHNIVNIKECPVLDQDISSKLIELKHAISFFAIGSYDIFITATDNGLDILIKADHLPDLQAEEAMAKFAHQSDISRISWQHKSYVSPIIIRKTPQLNIDQIQISIPPNCFLQATKRSEELIRNFIKEYSKNYEYVIDLYSGCGIYSFTMARYSKVHAVEGEKESINTIKLVSNPNYLVTAELRDLYRYPLTSNELNKYQLAVINPPRNGAEPQVRELAKSNVHNVIMISCNPKTFTRDIRILKNAGFNLKNSQAIDQFYWSNHLEILAFLTRNS